MKKPVSIKDIARHTHCAVSTVSNVLNGHRQFYSEETERKVLEACKQLGYTRNDSGRRLRTGRTETVGVVFTRVSADVFSSVFYLEMIATIQRRLAQLNHDLLLIENEPDAARVMRTVHQGKIDGIVLLGNMPGQLVRFLTETRTKTVVLDAHCDGMDSITSDGYTATFQIVENLAELGHTHIAYFAYNYPDFNTDNRIAGFNEAATRCKLKSSRVVREGISHDEVCSLFEKLMKGKQPPTALLAVNDELAYALLSHAQKLKLRVPQDICIFGYDDTQFAKIGAISTAHVEIAAMAERATDMLINRINKPDTTPQSIRMEAPLRFRKTCPEAAGPKKTSDTLAMPPLKA